MMKMSPEAIRRTTLTLLVALAAARAAGQDPRAAAVRARMAMPLPPRGALVAAPRLSERPSAAGPALDAQPSAARLHQALVVPVPKETAIYRHTFEALLAHPETTDRYDDLIMKYARKYRLDARFMKSIMAAESDFDPKAVSPAGARGLMQVMPHTSSQLGVPADQLFDPEHGIKAGAACLQELFQDAWKVYRLKGVRYADAPPWVQQRVIAAYHSGPKALTGRRWFRSTRDYVRKVILYYHSNVTDLRRPFGASRPLPSFAETVAPSGTLY